MLIFFLENNPLIVLSVMQWQQLIL